MNFLYRLSRPRKLHLLHEPAVVRLLAACALLLAILCQSSPVMAQSDASAVSTLSALPLASVLGGGSVAAGAVLVTPVALSAAGAALIVKMVESTARGTVCVLERISDGARVSLDIGAASAVGVSVVTGTVVTVGVIGAGVVLSTLGEVIAFLPNVLGTALLHNERLTF